MLLKLFLIFLKINFLTTSGPASIGFTQKLIVPELISQDKFAEIVAITSGIPGSDAMQMAWQTGYIVKGWIGAIISIIAALIPCILLVSLVMIGIKIIDPKILTKFFNGINPVLAVMLIFTALSLLPPTKLTIELISILILTIFMLLIKIPLLLCLIIGGLLGVIFL